MRGSGEVLQRGFAVDLWFRWRPTTTVIGIWDFPVASSGQALILGALRHLQEDLVSPRSLRARVTAVVVQGGRRRPGGR